jgi:hypothetical protein
MRSFWSKNTSVSKKSRNSRKPRAPLAIQALEDRSLMAWGSVPPAVVSIGSYLPLALNSQGDAAGSAAITSNEVDYYRFTATQSGSYRLAASTPSSNLDTVLGVFNSSGQRLAYNDDISSANRDSQLFVNLSAGNTYYFGITNYLGTAGGSYSWLVDGPAAPADDAYENNDSFGAAYNLGTLTTTRTISGLRMADSQDWFRFTMNGAGTTADYVRINFTHSQGDVDLELYNASGSRLRIANGVSNSETISLSGLGAGTYYVKVYGYNGAQNPNYSLTIDPGAGSVTPANKILYLNFDGASMSRSDLVRYAGADWSWSLNSLDSDANGISVQRFLANRTDREQIISQMITMVQADLNPFGIVVRRHYGAAVENQNATTIFLGQSTLTNGNFHVACDIDYGNNNRTDIAFVGNEYVWGSANDTAIAMADVTLHEAGHTFGLHHVNSGTALESMGRRYSTSQSQWVVNTSFMNQTFAGYAPHGTTPQNSYQVMVQNFGTGFGNPAASSMEARRFENPGMAFQLDCGMDNMLAHDEGDHDDHAEHTDELDALALYLLSEEEDSVLELPGLVEPAAEYQLAGRSVLSDEARLALAMDDESLRSWTDSDGSDEPAASSNLIDSALALGLELELLV